MKILLLEDNPADARLFEEYVNEHSRFVSKVSRIETLGETILHLKDHSFYDVIVTDLNVSDSSGLSTFYEIKKHANESAIVVVTGAVDEDIALKAVEEGAQDYIFKNDLKPEVLPRLLKYATQRKKSELELQKAKEEAEKLNTLKDQFVAMATHELRSPMNSIIGFTEVLLEEETKQHKYEMLEIIHNSSNKLLNHINNMLDLAKIRSGRMKLNESEFNIVDSFVEVLQMQKGQVKNKQVYIKNDVLNVTYENVIGDKMKFEQIFTNLLTNAMKFTDNGEIMISLFDKHSELDTAVVLLRIKDSGSGMSDEEINDLFLPYYQADTKKTSLLKGTGLGLTIVKTFLEMMNGKIKVTSKPGIGTTFLVEFPFKIGTNY